MRKLLRKVCMVVMGISILSLLGCSELNKKTAKIIEERLSEKYNESFEVKYIGERWGTKSNNTVTTYVKALDSDIMFTAVMDTSENIVENYPEMRLMHKFASVFNKAIENQGLDASSWVNIHPKQPIEVTKDMTIEDYLEKSKAEYIHVEIVMRHDESITAEKLKTIVQQSYDQFNGPSISATYWIFNDDEYIKVNEFLEKVANIDPSSLESYKYDRTVFVELTENGFVDSDEDINKRLEGGGDYNSLH
ncbi:MULTISPECIES: hypothetical protein [Paenibacillus]|uniref:Lipoprotein n=2 Tax=Paenibacillus lactis TaxID=228574 RepID=G4HPZ9_9BACL|nr:hypothetical protein [Paenibacillus lactis]EHB46478.1 hypothetical protein PaelaDRAFT_6060 [Paenibacillus lactis 154]MBP1896099.1 uncharacterized protein YceK [Paenibacillus lactis]HAF99930.1 hypothetical protein [Paenibacillus lactis]